MTTEKMTRLEKIALTSAVSGAVFNVFLYGIGVNLSQAQTGTLFIVRACAAVLQAAAFDLVAIATVMGMRHGRRSAWSLVTALMAALVSAFIALDVAGVWAQPWLHAANALIVLAFTMHLLTPTKLDADERQTMARLMADLADERHVVAELQNALADEQRMMAELQNALADERHSVAGLQRDLAAERRELAVRPPAIEVEVVYVAKHRLTWQQMEIAAHAFRQLESISQTTIRRRVAALFAPVADSEVLDVQ